MDIKEKDLSMRQIALDCRTIIDMTNTLKDNPIMAVEFTPFLSLFCNEALNYFEKYRIKLVLPQNRSFSLEDIRLKTKLFEDKYGKAKKMILNCDYFQDFIFRHKLRYKFMRSWNIHFNIGIFFDSEMNIVGNSQYAYYIYQDSKLLKKKIQEAEMTHKDNLHYELLPQESYDYGYYCGQVVTQIDNVCPAIANVKIESNRMSPVLYYKDYNTNKHFAAIYSDDEGKTLFLYILHILCFVNAAIKLFKLIEKEDHGWWLRLYYITYHYSYKRLEDIKNHINNKKINNQKVNELISILKMSDDILLNTEFRNCMMHYDFYDKNNRFLISPSYIDDNIPLFGLIESCYNGLKYEELKLQILEKLDNISKVLSAWFELDVKNPKQF